MRHGEFIQMDAKLVKTLASANRKDRYHVAAACGLFKLDGKNIKLTKSQQQAIFGGYVFGKANLRFEGAGQGAVHVWSSCAFGQDVNSAEFSFDEALALAGNGQRWVGGCINPATTRNNDRQYV